jgi:hypothetical protein
MFAETVLYCALSAATACQPAASVASEVLHPEAALQIE